MKKPNKGLTLMKNGLNFNEKNPKMALLLIKNGLNFNENSQKWLKF